MVSLKLAIFLLIRNLRGFVRSTPIGKVPAVSRALNKLYHIFYPKGTIALTMQGYKLFIEARDIGIAYPLLTHGEYEDFEIELFKKSLKEDLTVLDIGANIGYYSLIASGIVGEKGKVYAFEPDQKSYALLLKNIKANHLTNITPVKYALSNKTGKRTLFLDKSNLAAATFSVKNLHTEKEGAIAVQTTTLDEFLKDLGSPKIDVIKIDVQGAEGLVFEGAHEALKQKPLMIFMEFWPLGLRNLGTNPEKLLEMLKALGFTIQLIGAKNHRLLTLPISKILQISSGFQQKERSVNLFLSRP